MSEVGTELAEAGGKVQRAMMATAAIATGTKRKERQRIRIGHYELLRELGRGGMGTVYLARDTKLARMVALKVLLAPSPDLLERFLVEARATARCTHENIVVIHDVDEIAGEPYMVLEYLEGATLTESLSSGALKAGQAVELIIPVLKALELAHASGIVHRDLKPDNILLTNRGIVKVLDFGIAKLLESEIDAVTDQDGPQETEAIDIASGDTEASSIEGTMPYMSPEQWGADTVDQQSDLWAVGVILFEMLAGKHPLAPLSADSLMAAASQLDKPMPSIRESAPGLPIELHRIVDRCLQKRKGDRFESATVLLEALAPLVPKRGLASLGEESPFPGLSAFQESDSDRFFGRRDEVARLVARLVDQPLIGVVGPSGAGKSSLIRAGLIPALKSSTSAWESLIVRPGRDPLQALASALEPYVGTGEEMAVDALRGRLLAEPGYLGVVLRKRAKEAGAKVLLFVDQFEELFTLVDEERSQAFLRCMSGAGDDMASPVRVIVSMRSDFLDRASSQPGFMDRLVQGLVFLPPPSRAGLRSALVEPVAQSGHSFEDEAIVEEMLDELASSPGALPLLQFAAGRLWDERDRERKVLTRTAYDAIGGISGALASHADAILAGLPSNSQKLARAIFERLVTPERTRDVVELDELHALGEETEIRRLVRQLVDARILVVHTADDQSSTSAEIVHESLIESWPTLRRWLTENQEDAAVMARIRSAAKEWKASGESTGLLWRGEVMQKVRSWHNRYDGTLPARESEYLIAVFAQADRSIRQRRWAVAGGFALLMTLLVAGAVALVLIGRAEDEAQGQAKVAKEAAINANEQAKLAQDEAARAQAAETTSKRQLAELQAKEAQLQETLSQVTAANSEIAKKTGELSSREVELKLALARQEEISEKATKAADEARAAEAQALAEKLAKQALLEKETQRANRVEERQGGTISRGLKP